MPKSPTAESPSNANRIPLGELLRERPFMLYLAGQTTSGAGSALSSIALVFAVLAISRSPESVGLVLLASRLPPIALSFVGGVVADRWSRKTLTVSCDVIRAGAQAACAALLLTHHASVSELAALQFVSGGASALFTPAAAAMLAGVAPRGRIRQATSLLGMTTATTQIGGLAASGVLVALAGPGTSLAIDAATFSASAFSLALIPARVPEPAEAAHTRRAFLTDARDAVAIFGKYKWIAVYAFHETVIDLLVLGPFFVLGPVIAKAHLGGAPAWAAVALGYVIGNLIASNITYRWAPGRPVLAALAINLALTPMVALIGAAAALWLIIPASLLAGVATTIYNTLLGAAVQANLPDDTLGRATAVTSIGSTMIAPLGMGLAGVIAGAIGASTVLLAGATIVVAVTLACVAWPSAWTTLRMDRLE